VTALAWALFGAAAVAAVCNWVAVAVDNRWLEWFAKPATLALLIGVALALDPRHGSVRAWFVAGLLLSLAGDVFLMLPRDLFVAGLASFLAGHVAYIIGFCLEQRSWGLLIVGLILVAGFVVTIGRQVVQAVARTDRALVVPVVAYVVVISAMVVTAWGTALAWAVAGALLFYVSDATLAWNRFVARLRWGDVAVIVTYHLGQAGLVLALAAPR
jgi:uncharacterized membrane protein YhhN